MQRFLGECVLRECTDEDACSPGKESAGVWLAHTHTDTGKQTRTFNLFVFACCSISIDDVIRKFWLIGLTQASSSDSDVISSGQLDLISCSHRTRAQAFLCCSGLAEHIRDDSNVSSHSLPGTRLSWCFLPCRRSCWWRPAVAPCRCMSSVWTRSGRRRWTGRWPPVRQQGDANVQIFTPCLV